MMLELSNVTFAYDDVAILRNVNLHLAPGALHLVVGTTGSGKSTLLRLFSGLAPIHTGGTLKGTITKPAVIGYVPQDPATGFVQTTVEEELAFAMEQHAVAPNVMAVRMESVLDQCGIPHLRYRALNSLSGGQQQRVAIAAALTADAELLILDEPTSQLDPEGADDILGLLHKLTVDYGITVVIAEHRLERVVHYTDHVIYVHDGLATFYHSVEDLYETVPTAPAPPVVELSRLIPWLPQTVSVRDGRNRWGLWAEPSPGLERLLREHRNKHEPDDSIRFRRILDDPVARERDLRIKEFTLYPHYTTVVIGRNGSGKSTLLHAMASKHNAVAEPVRLVPQTASDLLYSLTVEGEFRQTQNAQMARSIYKELTGSANLKQNPRDLSAGQQLAVALAVQLAASPKVILLDEPTRGLDYRAKARLVRWLKEFKKYAAVCIATHDMEFAAECADEVVMLSNMGTVNTPMNPHEFLGSSGYFSTQLSRVTNGLFLTISEFQQHRELITVRTDVGTG